MKKMYQSIFEILALSSLVTVVDIVIAAALVLTVPSLPFFEVISNLLILEFGLMLIIGACLMSRQPIEEEKRYDEDGELISSWRMAMVGRMILGASVFVLVLAVLFALI